MPSTLALVCSGPAAAHGYAPIGPDDVLTHWSLDPFVLVPLLLAHWLYGRGLRDLRGRLGRPSAAVPPWRVAAFVAGEAALFVALISPLDALSGTLLTAHMTQHVVLVALAPPLLLLGRPEIACFRGLPRPWRRGLARDRRARSVQAALRWASRPLPATVLHGVALWAWHVPAAFEIAGGDSWLHALEHLCFFGTALLFWRGLIGVRAPLAAAQGALAALATLVHGGFLSALLALSPTLLYPDATRWAPLWGLTPLEDQQLAGTVMWVPMGAAYLVVGLWLAGRLVAPREPEDGRTVLASQPSTRPAWHAPDA